MRGEDLKEGCMWLLPKRDSRKTWMHEEGIMVKKVKRKRNSHKPWVTSGILKSIRRKDLLYKQWIRRRTDEILIKYKNYKNKLSQVLRVAEKMYYSEKFDLIKGNIKKTWQEINRILNPSAKGRSVKELVFGGKVVDKQEDVANAFNDYFVNIGTTLAKKITEPEGNCLDYIVKACGDNSSSMFVRPTDAFEICNIVCNLKSTASPGYDEISSRVLKSVIGNVSHILSDIFNMSLSSGIFPNRLKIAKVIPLYKSDMKTLVNNYRPISVLPCFSKILERLMYNRLLLYLNQHQILTDKQYGFREKNSTSLALINLIDKLSEEIDNKKFSVGIFIDLSKAFDTVDHTIMLSKLEVYGVRGHALNWFKSYLENRQQFVQLNAIKSRLAYIKCGVPQGSILGPLLFLIYINDIVHVSDIAQVIMFADDTNLFFSGCDMNSLNSAINNELKKFVKWFELNKLSLNVNKTHCIVFVTRHNRNIQTDFSILMDSTTVERVSYTKFLGVIINENLNWEDHIFTVKQKVSKNLGIIRNIMHKVPDSVLLNLYFSLIHPYLSYCNVVWAIDRSCVLNKLFILQKKAVRSITHSRWNCHSIPIFKRLGILPICSLNDLQIACFMYRQVHKLLPPPFSNMFQMNYEIHLHSTRQKNNLHVTLHRLRIRRNTVKIYGCKVWNSLPSALRNIASLHLFKAEFNKMLFSRLI